MLELLIVLGRAVTLALRGHRELVLENLALRQQLIVMNRATSRRHLQARSAVLDRRPTTLDELAHGAGHRAPRHRRGLAWGLASSAMDPTVETPNEWSATGQSRGPHPRP
jgi:hypothetical protein